VACGRNDFDPQTPSFLPTSRHETAPTLRTPFPRVHFSVSPYCVALLMVLDFFPSFFFLTGLHFLIISCRSVLGSDSRYVPHLPFTGFLTMGLKPSFVPRVHLISFPATNPLWRLTAFSPPLACSTGDPLFYSKY